MSAWRREALVAFPEWRQLVSQSDSAAYSKDAQLGTPRRRASGPSRALHVLQSQLQRRSIETSQRRISSCLFLPVIQAKPSGSAVRSGSSSKVPLLFIAAALGHRDARMVEKHYGHLAPSHVADAIRAALPSFGTEPRGKVRSLRSRARR